MPRKTGAMLCPGCRKLIGVDEPRCPFCGARRPGLWGWGPTLQRFFGPGLDMAGPILTACFLLYGAGVLLDPSGAMQNRSPLAFLSPSMLALYRLGMTGGWATHVGHEWTVLTAIYLHGGILHLGLNMMSFRDLGAEAQQLFGRARFFVLFTLAGAGGFLLSNAWGGVATIGASGSICGLLGARLAYARRRGGAMGEFVSRQTIQWIVILLAAGFMMQGINNKAHLGGLVTGYVLGRILPAESERHEGRGVQFLALVLVAATLVGFVLSLTHAPVLPRE